MSRRASAKKKSLTEIRKTAFVAARVQGASIEDANDHAHRCVMRGKVLPYRRFQYLRLPRFGAPYPYPYPYRVVNAIKVTAP